jgi:hypothetical protein
MNANPIEPPSAPLFRVRDEGLIRLASSNPGFLVFPADRMRR